VVPVLVHPSRVRTASWRDVCFLHDACHEWNAAHLGFTVPLSLTMLLHEFIRALLIDDRSAVGNCRARDQQAERGWREDGIRKHEIRRFEQCNEALPRALFAA
jgi:hypothetical protein